MLQYDIKTHTHRALSRNQAIFDSTKRFMSQHNNRPYSTTPVYMIAARVRRPPPPQTLSDCHVKICVRSQQRFVDRCPWRVLWDSPDGADGTRMKPMGLWWVDCRTAEWDRWGHPATHDGAKSTEFYAHRCIELGIHQPDVVLFWTRVVVANLRHAWHSLQDLGESVSGRHATTVLLRASCGL